MTSVRDTLIRSGLRPPLAIPEAFGTHPSKLGACIHMLNLPPMSPNSLRDTKLLEHNYGTDPQGVAFGGDHTWYLSVKEKIYRMQDPLGWLPRKPPNAPSTVPTSTVLQEQAHITLAEIKAEAAHADPTWEHIGDIDHRNIGEGHELVIAAIETKDCQHTPVLVALSEHLQLVGWAPMTHSVDRHAAWCAFSPWDDQIVYSSGKSDVGTFDAYNIEPLIELRRAPPTSWGAKVQIHEMPEHRVPLRRVLNSDGGALTGTELSDIQGVAFSPTGRMYVTTARDIEYSWSYENNLHVFNVISGIETGKRYYDLGGWGDEFEGLTFHPAGVLVIAAADWGSDLYLRRFESGEPTVPV